jgi:hypothetical protein
MKKTATIITGLSAVALAGALVIPAATFAAGESDTSDVVVKTRLGSTLAISSESVTIGQPMAGLPTISKVSVTTTTSNSGGYALTFKDKDTDIALRSGSDTIPSITSAGTLSGTPTAGFSSGTLGWGYYIGNLTSVGNESYSPIPDSDNPVTIPSTSAIPVADETIYISFGVSVSGGENPGEYSDTLTFTATANS